ncbi:DUF3108 domain-containing protein [Deefgea piscis]|uniref:DUF3108 domain-containing protein n=1 Tax=Deefgea piscis TaxID=2739061 RepID=UPI001C807C76|nr:DUF3108 domain-containing protein [Deefgea piscis]QZA80533.1 DUF3108 domain-containing protein [Deefgea piscis]
MKIWRYLFGFALLASVLLHLSVLLAGPIYDWWTQPEFEQTALRKTERKLAEQSLDESEKPAELANVQVVDQQQVFFAPATEPSVKPTVTKVASAQPKPRLKTASKPAALVASEVVIASAVTSEKMPVSVDGSDSLGVNVASAVVENNLASGASQPAVAVTAGAEPASKVANKASRVMAQLNREANKRFPKVVDIGYYWTVFDARMQWKIEKDQYVLRLQANPVGKKIEYLSEGKISAKNGVTPVRFADLSLGPSVPKNSVDFNWDTQTAVVGPPNALKTEPLEAGDQDLLSAALHLALMGSRQASYGMSLFSGKKRYPDVVFELKGEATLTLGTTKVDAVLMRAQWSDRQVDFWLAPEWNNLPVKMSVNLGKDGSFEILAKEVTLDGRKVLEWISPQNQQQRRP